MKKNIPRASVPIKSGLAPNPRTSNPKNSGISEAWNDPRIGVDLPRLNTDKKKRKMIQKVHKISRKKKTYGMRMQVVSLECFPEGICEVLEIKCRLEWQLVA